jgi:hypothetical protein
MQRMVSKILNAYGTAMTLNRGGTEYAVRAFFQPVRSKSWQYLEGNYSPLGEIPRGQYVYIGPADQALETGDTLTVSERTTWCVGASRYFTAMRLPITGPCAWRRAVRILGDNRRKCDRCADGGVHPGG